MAGGLGDVCADFEEWIECQQRCRGVVAGPKSKVVHSPVEGSEPLAQSQNTGKRTQHSSGPSGVAPEASGQLKSSHRMLRLAGASRVEQSVWPFFLLYSCISAAAYFLDQRVDIDSSRGTLFCGYWLNGLGLRACLWNNPAPQVCQTTPALAASNWHCAPPLAEAAAVKSSCGVPTDFFSTDHVAAGKRDLLRLGLCNQGEISGSGLDVASEIAKRLTC